MSQVITIPFTEHFLPHVVDYISHHYLTQSRDLSRLAIVFGGKRPALFIKRDLARRIKGAFMPPRFFTIDEWMAFVTQGDHPTEIQNALEHCYAIYQLALEKTPQILKGREHFAQFLPWAKEILHFFEQLDLEDVPLDNLKTIAQHAQIGFFVPEDINDLLKHLSTLRAEYHGYLTRHGLTTRGFQYLKASRGVASWQGGTFDEILFCNFFYLHKTENIVLKHHYQHNNSVLFLQGDQRRWPALTRLSNTFGLPILEGEKVVPTTFKLNMYEAFDNHAQAALVKKILEQIDNPHDTVIVLPNSDSLLPLLTAIGNNLEEFNISMGYPLKRSALYALLEFVMDAQNSRREDLFYARDYLKLMAHPLVKNLNLLDDDSMVRKMVYRIEEALKGQIISDISGGVFVSLTEIINDERLWTDVERCDELKQALGAMHGHLFKNFLDVKSPSDLGKALISFLDFMHAYSAMDKYPLNAQIARRLQVISQEFTSCSFAEEHFEPLELYRILQERLSSEMVSFTGSPLRGLQVLGLFETRALNFKNVIVLDVNEGALPNLSVYEPLIPREVMIKLNLDRLELEEEIQRYGFMRLISSAQHVHLIYQQAHDKIRSRFIEELIWEQERRSSSLGVVDIVRPVFEASVERHARVIPKTAPMLEFLSQMTFSASSINTYIQNPYDFYTQYVLGLKEQTDMLDDPQAQHIGTFIHHVLEETFKRFIGKKPVIDDAFKEYFYKIYQQRFEEAFGRNRRSDTFLMETVLRSRLEHFLKVEAKRCEIEVEKVLFIERKFDQVLDFNGRKLRFTFRVDRVDQAMDGKILIIDYKTGSIDPMPKDVETIKSLRLSRIEVRDAVRSFQLPLYANYLYQQYPSVGVDAVLYHLKTMRRDYFLKQTRREDIGATLEVYLAALGFIVEEIFNPEIPFVDDPVDIK